MFKIKQSLNKFLQKKRTKIELGYYEADHRKIQTKLHIWLNFYILDIF